MNTKIRFNHFHDGNDPWQIDEVTGESYRVRGPAIYATCAALVDLSTGNVVEEAWAYCNPTDVASRKKGRAIAEGRLKRLLDPDFHKNKNKARKKTKNGNPVPEQRASSIAVLL